MADISRDLSTLRHIVDYCDEIAETLSSIELTAAVLEKNYLYRNSLAMEVLQIGELVGLLTNEFTASHSGAPWRDIKAMRNIAAHHYGKLDVEKLLQTAKEDIGPLRLYCLECIKELEG
jgi:uncharacterized protein with HEPN domain